MMPGGAIKVLVLAVVIALLSTGASKEFLGRHPFAGGFAIVGVVGLLFALFPEAFFLKYPFAEEGRERTVYARRRGARLLGIALLVVSFLVFIYATRVG